MRQETIVKTYLKFNELSDKQKSKVLDKLRDINVEHDYWHEHITDDFKIKLESLGYSDIKTQFSGFWSQGDGASFSAKKEDLEITTSGRNCHDMTMQCESDSLLQDARKLAREYYKDLQKSYEYDTSDAAVIETIEANDYEFDSETLTIA